MVVKKIKGRKRHIVVDKISEILVACQVMAQSPTIKAFSADASYRKSFEKLVSTEFQCPVDISLKKI